VQSSTAKNAEVTLARAWLAYREGDLTAALAGGRRAVPEKLSVQDSLADEALVKALHLLSKLHFDKAFHTDSIGYYQRWAADLLDDGAPAVLLAENQLCLALDQLYSYTFSTQVSAARAGRELLATADRPYPELEGRLLVAEGLGLKKYADQQEEPLRGELLEEAAELMTNAVRAFRAIDSPRWREAQREKVIIVSRFQDRARFEDELRPLLRADRTVAFGFPDRLRGYYHHRGQRADSVLHYYTRFRGEWPDYDFHLQDETIWTLSQYAIKTGDLALAHRSTLDHMVLYGCRDAGFSDADMDSVLLGYPKRKLCYYALCDYGRYRLADYLARGDTASFARAKRAFDFLLDHWENVFVTGEEESALRQLTNITYKVVQNATTVDYYGYRDRPGPATASQLLNTLERTRTFLLLNDRLQPDARLRNWQSQINELKEKELRGGGLSRRERKELTRLSRLHRERNDGLREARSASPASRPGRRLELADLRDGMGPTDAILHFGEGNGRLIAQYIDADTVVVYALPRSEGLRDSIATYLKYLEGRSDEVAVAAFRSASSYLYELTVAPFAEALNQRRRLLIVPAGPLRRLPFGTLVTAPAGGKDWDSLSYLVDKIEIRYAPSLRVEALNAAARPAGYADRTVGNWTYPELANYFAGAERYLREMAAAGSTFFDGSRCSSGTFREQLGSFGIVNLSLHARGNPLSRYGNYLYFSGRDSLNAVELARLRCRASLVVLAACETGRGRQTVGEGTFSIARGFQQLGVPDVVYSLWRIPASASAQLQRGFYEQLYRGHDPAAALTLAKRRLRAGRYAFPGYWGGLVKG
jgi:hypothetical protein